ncbi:MAG: NADH-quinone oxidoreductase subunit N [Vicinamibacteria bacterium]|nr:NADH-quinone oxidoreductase subunit N [Vicinamibacteria bacterium]
MPAVDLRPLLPALIVAVTALVVLLAQAFTPKGSRSPSMGLTVTGLAGALLLSLTMASDGRYGRGANTGGSVVADDFTLFFHVLLIGLALMAALLSPAYYRENGGDRGEYYSLMMFSLVGMLGLVSATEMISMFVALEIMSVALYALCGTRRDQVESQEAALKYFVTGAFASAFLLFGMALLYGLSGSTSLARVARGVATATPEQIPLAVLGCGLLIVGFGFKVASVPFHMWTPDVYEGAPTTVTALMAAGVKAASFGAFLRVFLGSLPTLREEWVPALAALAAITMVIGNLGALAQSNLKRMLAFSSVAHAGYLMTGMVGTTEASAQAILFYLVAYGAVNMGTFGLIASLSKGGREPLSLQDVAGLGARRPAIAASLTVFLISLTGIPISGGFVGKFYLFGAAVNAGYTGLAIIGVLMSVVSAYYYLRVVVAMYMREPEGEDVWSTPEAPGRLAALIAVAVTLGLGIWPAPVLDLARAAALSLL